MVSVVEPSPHSSASLLILSDSEGSQQTRGALTVPRTSSCPALILLPCVILSRRALASCRRIPRMKGRTPLVGIHPLRYAQGLNDAGSPAGRTTAWFAYPSRPSRKGTDRRLFIGTLKSRRWILPKPLKGSSRQSFANFVCSREPGGSNRIPRSTTQGTPFRVSLVLVEH